MSAGAPWFVLVAGINGAGKSTFAQDHATLRVLLEAQGPEIEVISPDLITGEILHSELLLPLEEANIRAADECARRVRDLVKRADRSFVIETVLSTDDAAFDAKGGGLGRGFGAGPRAIVAQCTSSIRCWA